jgi:hypothetical protein
MAWNMSKEWLSNSRQMNLSTLTKFTWDYVLGSVSQTIPCAESNSGCARFNAVKATSSSMMSIGPEDQRSIALTQRLSPYWRRRLSSLHVQLPEGGSCNRVAPFVRKDGIQISLSSMGAAPVDKWIGGKTQWTYGTNDSLSRSCEKRWLETSGDGRLVLVFSSLLPSPNVGSGQRWGAN